MSLPPKLRAVIVAAEFLRSDLREIIVFMVTSLGRKCFVISRCDAAAF
jgi:hypothetical protein